MNFACYFDHGLSKKSRLKLCKIYNSNNSTPASTPGRTALLAAGERQSAAVGRIFLHRGYNESKLIWEGL